MRNDQEISLHASRMENTWEIDHFWKSKSALIRGGWKSTNILSQKCNDLWDENHILLSFSKKCCFLQHFQKSITSLLLVKNGHLRYVKTSPGPREHVCEKKKFLNLVEGCGSKNMLPAQNNNKNMRLLYGVGAGT